ncbi:hypothetical protein LY78DRAFT_660204 [Colletotrichum sublineola]|uniref:Uncharacterized protein n=1 Tax=Colletotrichum sublineola TaxID=1173701 RepID=A0A066XWK9_COLSU|nr:hypothetical protein LY78DRAFT_660204 [Colletotrichum sublineola]KDN70350.1 hypothetical protein CSUB01_08404 [Colletotrichum sublineola]
MKFSLAILATAMVAAVSAAPSTTLPLEIRQECLPDGTPCDRHEQCCTYRCTWGSLPPTPEHPARCGNQVWPN